MVWPRIMLFPVRFSWKYRPSRLAEPTISSRVAGRCIARLGYIAFARCDFESARVNFDEALRISQRSGLAEIEADCIRYLGDVGLVQSELETARGRFQEAVTLFRKCKHQQGETASVYKLGDIALAWSDHDMAREYLQVSTGILSASWLACG